MTRATIIATISALIISALPLSSVAKEPDIPPALAKYLQLMGQGAYFSGYCSKYISEDSQREMAALINGEGVKFPPKAQPFKAEFVAMMQNLYMKGLAAPKDPSINQESCKNILSDITNEITAITD